MSIPAYILAGGKSSRFGSDKARALFAGTPLTRHIANVLDPMPVTAVAESAGKYEDLGIDTIADVNPGMGPLAGLQAAICDAKTKDAERLLLVSCDLHAIQRRWIDDLLDSPADADVIAYRGEFWEPLCAIYRTRLEPEVNRRLIEKDLSMQRLIDSVKNRALPRPENWAQANTPAELTPTVYSILVFGPVAQAAASPTLRVSLTADNATCAQLRVAITQQYPATEALLRSCRFAVNHAFAAETNIVTPGDEIALIGLVCGG